jgi:hypothetical protein
MERLGDVCVSKNKERRKYLKRKNRIQSSTDLPPGQKLAKIWW